MVTAGDLGGSHDLSRRARDYANEVIFGDEWPLTPDHVNLSRVTFETRTVSARRTGAAIARFACPNKPMTGRDSKP